MRRCHRPDGRGLPGRALVCALDWSATPVGPAEGWPENLRAALGVCLNSRFRIHAWCGSDLTLIYSDGYMSFLGPSRHAQNAMTSKCSLRHDTARYLDDVGPRAATRYDPEP